jgi:glycosyltransferase involved in cell wall biosynthesis
MNRPIEQIQILIPYKNVLHCVFIMKSNKPLRILAFYTLSSSKYGKIVSGSERRFLEISRCLKRLSVEVFTIEYLPSISKSWGYSGYSSIGMKPKFTNHDFLETLRLIIHGLSECLRLKCDIIYSPGGFPWSRMTIILPPYIVSFLCRKPLVIVFHHLHAQSRLKNVNIFMRTMIKLAIKHAKVCIAVSKATEEDLRQNYEIGHTSIVGNGVNFNAFKEIESHRKKYDAAYLGRVSKEKGICTLIESWSILINQTPKAILVLIGGINDNFKNECCSLVKKFNLSKNVVFTGFISDQEVATVLHSSKLFVFPSEEEGFGLAILEAMAAGLPCILSDLPALRENFNDYAIFVRPNDVKGFAQAALDLLHDHDRFKLLQTKGKRLAKDYSWDNVARKELAALRLSLE